MGDPVLNYTPDTVSPPGETLRDLLAERDMSQTELANRMGRPLKTVNELIQGKAALTPETAVQLESVLGTPASFWMRREASYREYLARAAHQVNLADWQPWLAESLPVAEMVKLSILPPHAKPAAKVEAALRFFGVAAPDDWRKIYEAPQVAYRKSRVRDGDSGAISVWLRQAEIASEKAVCSPYDADAFAQSLRDIRQMTVLSPEFFAQQMVSACARSGVALVFVPAIRGAGVSGATRWLSPTKAMIALSLHGRSNDRFWFTFFHEACHILKHGKKLVFIDNEASGCDDEDEREADQFAADFLLPPECADELRSLPRSEAAVRVFASKLNIAPGIVVGRMQHEGWLPRTHLNRLKVPYQITRSSDDQSP